MTPLRQRMIEDMTSADWQPRPRRFTSKPFAAGRPPPAITGPDYRGARARLSLEPREGGAARGIFKTSHYGIQFLYRHTRERDWSLF